MPAELPENAPLCNMSQRDTQRYHKDMISLVCPKYQGYHSRLLQEDRRHTYY